jgi:hypothetical protein
MASTAAKRREKRAMTPNRNKQKQTKNILHSYT